MDPVASLTFQDDRSLALEQLTLVEGTRGWINLSPLVVEEVEALRVNVWSLRSYRGVPVATWMPAAASGRKPRGATLGVLHTRGRLSPDRLATLIGENAMLVRQNDAQRGLLLEPAGVIAPAALLDLMCRVTASLCDFTATGRWRLERFAPPR